jgi:hypothetical protein
MTKSSCVALLFLAAAVTATAKPRPPVFESRTDLFRRDIKTFVGSHFGDSTLCPIPSREELFSDNDPTDLLNGSLTKFRLGRTGPHYRIDYISVCLTEFQDFLLTQHIDGTTLADLKSWASQLPINARSINKFETWIDNQNFGGHSELTAVPEPGTATTFLCGAGLLAGVLLRRRRS